jgi:uncharacterized iron-regulated membrane protein
MLESSEATSVVSGTSSTSPKGFLLMVRCLLALSMLSISGCVMWPQKTTYYEAVDKPWIPAHKGARERYVRVLLMGTFGCSDV